MIKCLIYLVFILVIVAVAQLVRIFELASTLKGGQSNEVSEKDNKMQGKLMFYFFIAFMIFCVWQLFEYGDKILPVAASDVGAKIDWLMWFNMIIISIVFVITNMLLFYFAYKYYGKDNNKATFFPHDNKLELLWTTVPAVVLFVIIFLGLRLWNSTMMDAPKADALVIELYAKQFDWTARYAGADNQLGVANYKLITGVNALGMDSTDEKGGDDILARNEFHIPKGRQIAFKIRSRDVIHSMFMPHFRAQMNAVPGMTTMFNFTPTITTKEMRQITKNEKFEYVLMCNKICGASHYNMQMAIVVDEPADYEVWIAKQKPFFGKAVTASLQTGKAIMAQK